MVSVGTAPGETKEITMGLLNFMCPGMVYDQDGGEWPCPYSADGLQCPECDGVFCDRHFADAKAKCLDCAGGEPIGKWDCY